MTPHTVVVVVGFFLLYIVDVVALLVLYENELNFTLACHEIELPVKMD